MKDLRTVLVTGSLLCLSLFSNAQESLGNSQTTQIQMSWQYVNPADNNTGIHRTPVQVPTVYLNTETATLSFENPCYECTLKLVFPGTETVAYTYSIPDGDDTVQLPSNLSGTYELHIHRGNYCFFGEIEL